MFYVFRFCTAYMLVVISIERFNVLSNSLAYKTKCYSYILLVILCSSELCTHQLDHWKKDSRIYFFLVVTSTLPRFFHEEYKYDEFGNGTYMTTSLYRDKTYNLFWHSWQSLTNTCIPSIALITINGKILWHLAKSKQNDAKISLNNGLRIHVGWVLLVNS